MRRLAFLLAILVSACAAWAQQRSTFVFVKVEESIMPIERGRKYEDPLDDALRRAGLGEVTGGGSSLSKDKKIVWVGIDVELVDVSRGIPFLRKLLIELGAPRGSTLEYRANGQTIRVPVHAPANEPAAS